MSGTIRRPSRAAGDLHASAEPLTEALEREWDALADRVAAPPFLRPGYVAIWRHAFAADRPAPEVVAVRRDGELVAALPVMREGGRVVPPSNSETVVAGILATDDRARDAAAEALLGLDARLVSLDQIDVDGPTHAAVAATAARTGHRLIRRPTLRSPVVDTDGGWDAYWGSRSRNLRHNVRRCTRRLEERGELRVDVRRSVAPGELGALLAEGFAVEGSGWKTEQGTAILTSPVIRRYYTDLSEWAARHGWLRPSFLRLDGRAIAFCLGFETGGVFYALKLGYDDGLSRLSPGTVLLHGLIRHTFDEGLSRFDFAGRDEAYKLTWATGVEEQIRIDAFAPTPAGTLAYWARRARIALASAPLAPSLRAAAGRVRAVRGGHRPGPAAQDGVTEGRDTP
jgi:CelD/BcsL family acetyltransferase involved in cellulose biosynthesis